jgi:hypothetical protein
MPTTLPTLKFDHLPGFEIETEHKNAIRELYGFGKKTTPELMQRYKLGRSTIHRVLGYDIMTRARPTRTRRPPKLSDARVNEIIKYCSKNWEHRILDYKALVPTSPPHKLLADYYGLLHTYFGTRSGLRSYGQTRSHS